MKTKTLLGFGLAVMAAGIGLLARTSRRDAPPSAAPEEGRNPYLDRRGPNRPANVVRPVFGRRAANGRPGDWETF